MQLKNNYFLALSALFFIGYINTSQANVAVEYFCPSQAKEIKVLRYLTSRDIHGGGPAARGGTVWYVNLQSGAAMRTQKSGTPERKKLALHVPVPQYLSYFTIIIKTNNAKPTPQEFRQYLLADKQMAITTGAGIGATQIHCTYTNPHDPNQAMKNDAIFGLAAWEKLGVYRIDNANHGLIFFDVGKSTEKVAENYFTLQ